ncbi:MAG: competence/damage-inducible protein A [Myxococcota bacterium]
MLAGPMNAAVLSIGTELTRGELVDTNAAWLSEELTRIGHDVRQHASVDDDPDRIVEALRRLTRDAEVLLVTGGLGPTTDDCTAAAAAVAFARPIERRHDVVEKLRRLYASRQRELTESGMKQADFPKGAAVLENRVGTAPGFSIEHGASRAYFMPGVPREMKAIFGDHIAADLGVEARTTHQMHLRTFGIPESDVADRIADIAESFPGVTFGYRASFPEIEVKVHARAESESEARLAARAAGEQIRERLGDVVYGERDDTFAGAVGHALRHAELTLAVAESCTGGLIGAMLTAVPGSSRFLQLDAVTYANAAKTAVLGVGTDLLRTHGAVSPECARAMAFGARRIAETDVNVSITGIAGPGGGTEQKPVGTVCFGLVHGDHASTYTHRFTGDRERVRTRAAYVALDLVRRSALGLDLEVSPRTRVA